MSLYPRTTPPITVEEAKALLDPATTTRYVYCVADLGHKPVHGGESTEWIRSKWQAFARSLGIESTNWQGWSASARMYYIGKKPRSADGEFDAWLAENYITPVDTSL